MPHALIAVVLLLLFFEMHIVLAHHLLPKFSQGCLVLVDIFDKLFSHFFEAVLQFQVVGGGFFPVFEMHDSVDSKVPQRLVHETKKALELGDAVEVGVEYDVRLLVEVRHSGRQLVISVLVENDVLLYQTHPLSQLRQVRQDLLLLWLLACTAFHVVCEVCINFNAIEPELESSFFICYLIDLVLQLDYLLVVLVHLYPGFLLEQDEFA